MPPGDRAPSRRPPSPHCHLSGGLPAVDAKDAARTQVRFTFCQRPEVLAEALARLSQVAQG
jgi:hypothetical protein